MPPNKEKGIAEAQAVAINLLESLGNLVRARYANFLNNRQILPVYIQQRLAGFYLTLNRHCQDIKNGSMLSPQDLQNCQDEANKILEELENLAKPTDYAFTA